MSELSLDAVYGVTPSGTLYYARENHPLGALHRRIVRVMPAGTSHVALARREAWYALEVAHNHRGMLTVFAFGMDKDRPFMVHEYVEGRCLGTIAHWFAGEYQAIRQIGVALTTTLIYLHERGFAHGSLCQDAVLVGSSGEVKIHRFEAMSLMDVNRTRAAADVRALGVLLMSLLFGIRDGEDPDVSPPPGLPRDLHVLFLALAEGKLTSAESVLAVLLYGGAIECHDAVANVVVEAIQAGGPILRDVSPCGLHEPEILWQCEEVSDEITDEARRNFESAVSTVLGNTKDVCWEDDTPKVLVNSLASGVEHSTSILARARTAPHDESPLPPIDEATPEDERRSCMWRDVYRVSCRSMQWIPRVAAAVAVALLLVFAGMLLSSTTTADQTTTIYIHEDRPPKAHLRFGANIFHVEASQLAHGPVVLTGQTRTYKLERTK